MDKTENFIKKVQEIHGNKYDYSKVEYVNNSTKVCIICPIHGEFWQTPKDHIKGQGCRACGMERTASARRLTLDKFLEKAKAIHGDKYDYSKVEYVNSSTKVCIICPTHGEFWQRPNAHLSGKGCHICRDEKLSKTPLKFSTEEFIEKCKELHGNSFTYEKTAYNGLFKKVTVTCKKHGDVEMQALNLLNGHGCKKCAVERTSAKRMHNLEWLIERGIEKHGDNYEYFEYNGLNRKVKFKCKKCGSVFYKTPNKFLNSCGCPKCNSSSLEVEIRAFLENKKIEFVEQFRLGRKRVDFVIPSMKIAIECQGEQHFKQKFSRKGIDVHSYDLEKCIERDIEKFKELRELGYEVKYYTKQEWYPKNYDDERFCGIYDGAIYTNKEELIT